VNIAIIDDNEADLFLIDEVLSHKDYDFQIKYYRYLNDFLQSCNQYDLIITDLCLPDVYGPDVVQRIRQVTGKPIIVLSGVGGTHMPEKIARVIHNSGATIFLSKNYNGIQELSNAIQQFL
jgi:CheY-like chemotaxis protein